MKKLIIASFMSLYNKDSGEDRMPNHLWHRWYGIDGKFYSKLWEKLEGDTDENLFDDFCDVSFDVKNRNFDWMANLPRKRMHKLFLFSAGMLSHYLVVSFIWKITEFVIGVAYRVTRPSA